MAKMFMILCFILVIYHRVEGIRTLDKNEEHDANFKIMTEHGEVYDCVDFHKQRAFDHPLLRNATLKVPQLGEAQAPTKIGLKDGGCPYGTVPISRTNNENHNLYPTVRFQETISPQYDPSETDHCYAIVRTNDPSSKFLGGSGDVSVYNPHITSPQWSATRMRLQNGLDSIEVGWMVNQDMFKDSKTHLYVRFMAGGSGCVNLQCPGFVQVAKSVPLGLVPDKVSERGFEQYGWTLAITKHQDDGHWWLSIGEQKHVIGYWPKSLFTSLADFANQVEWGGEVYNPPNISVPPDMGCGFNPDYDTQFAAFYSNASIVDIDFHVVNPPSTTVKYQNCKETYTVLDAGDTGVEWGRIILFGGPGPSH